ncbi:MAG: pentapeptide repeat-containing protein [Xenococcaceae cyanobacterium]
MVRRVASCKFITTEPLSKSGEAGEQLVWDTIRTAFADRECIGYWRYPIFSQGGKFRKEPDILIADFELGLIVIEVKSVTIDQIVNITGHRWEYQNFYTPFGNPYQQAENQLFALLEYSDREPTLHRQISGRAIIALPLITQQQWQKRGFHQLPTNPPILFKNHLRPSASICGQILQTPPVIQGKQLTLKQWKLLLSVLGGTTLFCQPSHRVLTHSQSRGSILIKLRSRISELDWQQEHIGKEIPPGPQRIRGIAGSGKTILLCQKAAHMHLKHPDWKIAFVFFSRSLYHPIIEQLDKWLRYFSNNQQGYDLKNRQFRVLHAWGGRKQPGLYSTLCNLAGVHPLTVNDTQSKQPNEALAEVCIQLLKETAIYQLFDAILIDEGQDLIVDDWKFEDKQPFYWMAYQALRPADPVHPEQKRLIWAYDEAQSLESLNIPTASELFGEKLGHLVTGKYIGGIKKSEIMHRCYRTPGPILTAAHGIGMGLLRPGGMLTGITRTEEWKAIGYEVKGHFIPGQQITLKRPIENSPNPISELWRGSIIEFKSYRSRQQELTILAKNITYNLRYDGLRPSREILVIVLGSFFEAARLETHVAGFLIKQGIDIFIPSSRDCNILKPDKDNRDPNKFWCEGAVTVSRIHRAKGNEADMVYVVGLDNVAKDESNIYLRNQLFVALTRARAWVKLSGIDAYPMYEEMHRVIQSGDTFTFTFRRPPKREISVTDAGELLKRYALGGRNFQNADLREAQLAGVHLRNANLIGANLSGTNLKNAQLNGVKLVVANLSKADLTGASLRKAKLMGAILQDAKLSDADLSGADLSDADLTGANLEEADLTDAIMPDSR